MEPPHAVIFPYDEHGHVSPAFALGRALAGAGVRVTLVLTASRSALFSTQLDSADLFRIKAIHPPAHAHGAAADDPHDDVCFQHSLQKLEPAVEDLLLHLQPRPSCLISDLLYPWSQDLAHRLRLPRFHLCVHAALLFLLVFHFPILISKGLLPFQPGREDEVIDCIPALPKDFRLADFPVDLLQRNREQLEIVPRAQRVVKRAAGTVLCNSLYELEPEVMEALSAEGLCMYAVGPMLSTDWKGNCKQIPYVIAEDDACLRWLDTQPGGAVVYVALGSLVSLTGEEIEEVALGLEACGQPFLWVLPPAGAISDQQAGSSQNMAALPVGFLERTKDRGRVIAWAPQSAVLAHASLACFLSHCGLSSVMEAIWAGVPIIAGFCKVSEQNMICRLATKEWGVAIPLRDRQNAGASASSSPRPADLPLRCAVERCVKEVIHGKKGLVLSRNVMQLKATVTKAVQPDGSSFLSLQRLVDAISNTMTSN